MKVEDFHAQRNVEYAQELLQKHVDAGNIDSKEQDLFLKFLESRMATQRSFGGGRYLDYVSKISHLRHAKYVKVPWYELTYSDLLAAVSDIKSSPMRDVNSDGEFVYKEKKYAQNTLNILLRQLVIWVKWLSDNGVVSITEKEIQSIQIPPYKPKKMERESVYTEKMISKLLEEANPMMKAMIWTHYEIGARPNEICDLRWKDIEWRDKSALVTISDTKENQSRKAFISANSISCLLIWRNMYPGTASGDNLVFINNRNTPIKYITYAKYVRDLQFTYENGERVRRMPQFTPHDIRRWRATNLFIQGASRSAVCTQLWGTTKTVMDSVYSQYDSENMFSEMEQLYGIAEEPDNLKPLAPNYCPVCQTLNPQGNRYCKDCGAALDPAAAEALATLKQESVSARKERDMQPFLDDLAAYLGMSRKELEESIKGVVKK